jgi:hypothetical protein
LIITIGTFRSADTAAAPRGARHRRGLDRFLHHHDVVDPAATHRRARPGPRGDEQGALELAPRCSDAPRDDHAGVRDDGLERPLRAFGRADADRRRMQAAVKEASKAEIVRARLDLLGAQIVATSGAELRTFLDGLRTPLAEVIAERKITIN